LSVYLKNRFAVACLKTKKMIFSGMIDFKDMKDICQENSEMIHSLVEEFLVYYVASKENLEREMNERLSRYRHITREFKDGWVNLLKMQYIVHRIFEKNGLIKKFLSHSALKHLHSPERRFLEYQAEHPWRFSFSIITGHPAEHFYTMEDVFTGDSFLLYSPGVNKILMEQQVALWFNLLGYNGACWQSFGPIGAYQSFQPDDIFFYTTELHPHKCMESGEDIIAAVEGNPVPYMMLLSGAAYPLTFHKEDQIVQVIAEYDYGSFDTGSLYKHFKVEYADGIYRLILKRWSCHPHFSMAYYDEKSKVLFLSSMTDRGFKALVNRLNTYGYELSNEPDTRVNLSMIITAKKILKKDIRLNEYESLFTAKPSEEDQKNINKINRLLKLALPDINARREPDIEALAEKTGVDVETAREIVSKAMNKIKEMRKPPTQ
jgi:hypothetical protein